LFPNDIDDVCVLLLSTALLAIVLLSLLTAPLFIDLDVVPACFSPNVDEF